MLARNCIPDPLAEFHSPYLGMGNNPVILIDPNGGETKHRNGLAGGSCGARDIKLAFSSLDGNISKVINTDLPQGNAIYGGSNKNILKPLVAPIALIPIGLGILGITEMSGDVILKPKGDVKPRDEIDGGLLETGGGIMNTDGTLKNNKCNHSRLNDPASRELLRC